MSIEVIPEAYSQSFDPLANLDHELVSLYTQARVVSPRGVSKELQRLFEVNRKLSSPLVDRLIGFGQYLEPCYDSREPIDETFGRLRSFNAGAMLALLAISNMAYEVEVHQLEWRNHWVDLPEGRDGPLKMKVDASSTPDDFYLIGNAIMDVGHKRLASAEAPYQRLVENVSDAYSSGSEFGNVLQASFGYVFGVGTQVLREVATAAAIETEVYNAFGESDSRTTSGRLDDEYKELVLGEENV